MTQEDIYDEKVSPLVKQIIEICKEHKIPCLMSFACPNDEPENGDSLMCTTAILEDDGIGKKERLKEALRVLRRGGEYFAFAITHS